MIRTPFSTCQLPLQHHEVEFPLTHKSQSPIFCFRKRDFLSPTVILHIIESPKIIFCPHMASYAHIGREHPGPVRPFKEGHGAQGGDHLDVESNGMVLAAEDEPGFRLHVPDAKARPGSKTRQIQGE